MPSKKNTKTAANAAEKPVKAAKTAKAEKVASEPKTAGSRSQLAW